MKLSFTRFAKPLAVVLGLFLGAPLQAGTVFVNSDEWALSNSGFTSGVGTAQFVNNIVAEFGTTLHAYSTNNIAYGQSSLSTAMANAGATFTIGTGFAFNLANISTYSGLFLAGPNYLTPTELTDLTTYVANGGNVYISAGTGSLGAVGEAAAWNGFLAQYNIQLGSPYSGNGLVNVSGDTLFNGVTSLLINGANTITGSSVVCCNARPTFAVSRMNMTPVPVPAAGVLLGSVLLTGAGWRALRRRS